MWFLFPSTGKAFLNAKLWTNDHHDSEDMFLFPSTGKAFLNS